MNEKEILLHYQKCINKIDDFFEYRYLRMSSDECKGTVMGFIDEMTLNLKQEEL